MHKLAGLTCLVTGGAGFIGSHLCERLLREGASVVCFDNLSSGSLEHLKLIRHTDGFAFVEGDMLNRNQLCSAMEGADIVFHLAARVGVKRYVENPAEVIRVNVLGTHNALEECVHHGIQKLVFASTSEVYGKNPNVPLSEDSDRILGPTAIDRWCYSSSKAVDEHLINGYSRLQNLRSIVLRYFNTYGPRQHTSDYGGVVSIFLRRLLHDEAPLVHGDGNQTRSFCYIDDAIEATYRAVTIERAVGETINVGRPVETKIIDLAELACTISGKAGIIAPKCIAHDEFYGHSYEDIPRRVPDITKARSLLNFDPIVDLAEGLRRTWQWYSAHM